MSFKADLHIHSFYSDGTMSCQEILYLAKQKELNAISITDHDTINAYNENLFQLAKELNIKLITGVEISSSLDDISIHILGYNFDYTSLEFNKFLAQIQNIREQRLVKILQKLEEKKINISEEELKDFAKINNEQTIISRLHIAQLMYKKGYVATVQDAFDNYIKDNGPCYVCKYLFTPEQIIQQIHLANGKAILAHPSLIKKKALIKDLLKLDFDGIEVYYSKLKFNEEKKWLKIAQDNNLLITGGSDFHGANNVYVDLGSSWIDKDNFNKLLL